MMDHYTYMSEGTKTGRFNLGPKVCEIVNAQFCYFLRADGVEIAFQGAEAAEAADYFAAHYRALGYEVIRKVEHAA